MISNDCFKKGKLTILLDGGAGSSGKGKLGSFVTETADNWEFACNTFTPQAGHWVRLQDGTTHFYQTLNSCAYQNSYEKLYLGPGSIIELPALLREMEDNNVPIHKLGIHPTIPILDEEIDAGFERGTVGFDGTPLSEDEEGTMKFGSTCHGVGSAMARRVLRRKSVQLARDIPVLKEAICNVPEEIMERLENGQSGLLEIGQGFQLSLMHANFFPYVTSRNVTVSQGLNDMMLPTRYAGPVILNFRTYPIRISSKKYIGEDGSHLTWDQVQAGVPHEVYTGDSGPWYPDQKEIDWEELTRISGSPDPILELTSVTKLPRRVATFSKMNVHEAIAYNSTGDDIFLSINFANYVDHEMTGLTQAKEITEKFDGWIEENLGEYKDIVKFIGTGATTGEMIKL